MKVILFVGLCLISLQVYPQNIPVDILIDRIVEDSLLLRQVTGPVEGTVTRYHPVINRPLSVADGTFDGKKENRAVFLAYAPRQYVVPSLQVSFL